MRFASLVLSACVLTACGGGGGGGDGSKLSASQAAYESLVLSPGAVYQVTSSLPLNGLPVSGTHHLYDKGTSLPKSPLTNGPQRLSVSAWSTINPRLALPSTVLQQWILFNKTPYKFFDQVRELKYLGDDMVESIITTGGAVIASQTSISVTATPLTGALASAANIPSTLFSNPSLLKTGAVWQSGSAYLNGIWKLNADSYSVSANNIDPEVLKPIATGSTIQQQIDANTLSYSGDFPAVKYNLGNGSIKPASAVNTGVTTFVATSPYFGDVVSGYYRTFYEINGDVYAGSLYKSGALVIVANYNTKARESIQAALNF
jgi:hypothetical protein